MPPTGINRPGYSSPKSPTGINRPGYSSPKPPTGVNRPGRDDNDRGPNIVMKSKPSVPSPALFSRDRGQSGGINSISPAARVQYYKQQDPYGPANIRQKYFDNRPIPTERLQRRGMQDQLLDQFKAQYTKPVVGSSNLLQMTADAPMSLADYRNQLAFELGPTPSELMGDARYALGSIAKGLAEKGTPMMNLAKSLFGGVQNFFGNRMASSNQFNQQLLSLTPQQRMVYDRLITQPGMTRENAYSSAIQSGMASGGIATLH